MSDRVFLLVGEDFGNADPTIRDDRYALTGQSGHRLADLAGVDFPVRFLRLFRRMNVVQTADQWSQRATVQAGVGRIAAEMHGRRTILLGSRVAAAFGVSDLPLFAWSDWNGHELARMPHPSGRSRWWNEPENVEAARAFLRDTISATV